MTPKMVPTLQVSAMQMLCKMICTDPVIPKASNISLIYLNGELLWEKSCPLHSEIWQLVTVCLWSCKQNNNNKKTSYVRWVAAKATMFSNK